jgi:hypothetical protein
LIIDTTCKSKKYNHGQERHRGFCSFHGFWGVLVLRQGLYVRFKELLEYEL